MLEGMRDACAFRWTTHSACFASELVVAAAAMEKSTPVSFHPPWTLLGHLARPRHIVVVKSTLAVKEEKKAELDSQSGTAKKLHHHHHGKVEMDESKERNVSCSRTVRGRGTNHPLCPGI
jgi:hypothetical protein